MLSGTSLGYVLFLGIELPLGRAYGGSQVLAGVAVTGLWLYLLHVMVLLGYVVTLRVAARGGRPLGPVLHKDRVRAAPSSAAAPDRRAA